MLPQQTATSLQTYDAPSTTHPSPLLLLNKLLPYVRKFALPLRSQIRTAPTTTPTFPHHSCTSPHLHQLVPSHFTPLISHRLQQKRRTRHTPIPKPPLSAPHTPQTHFSSTAPCLPQLVRSRFPPPSAAEPLTSHAHSELPPPHLRAHHRHNVSTCPHAHRTVTPRSSLLANPQRTTAHVALLPASHPNKQPPCCEPTPLLVPNNFSPPPRTAQTHHSSTSPLLLQLVPSRFPPPSAAQPLTWPAHAKLPPPHIRAHHRHDVSTLNATCNSHCIISPEPSKHCLRKKRHYRRRRHTRTHTATSPSPHTPQKRHTNK